jgi:hypothetical protein
MTTFCFIYASLWYNIKFLVHGFGRYWLKNLASDISVRCTFKHTTGHNSINITGALHLKIVTQCGVYLCRKIKKIETGGAEHQNINILSLSANPM